MAIYRLAVTGSGDHIPRLPLIASCTHRRWIFADRKESSPMAMTVAHRVVRSSPPLRRGLRAALAASALTGTAAALLMVPARGRRDGPVCRQRDRQDHRVGGCEHRQLPRCAPADQPGADHRRGATGRAAVGRRLEDVLRCQSTGRPGSADHSAAPHFDIDQVQTADQHPAGARHDAGRATGRWPGWWFARNGLGGTGGSWDHRYSRDRPDPGGCGSGCDRATSRPGGRHDPLIRPVRGSLLTCNFAVSHNCLCARRETGQRICLAFTCQCPVCVVQVTP
jgi:hypothetical protein